MIWKYSRADRTEIRAHVARTMPYSNEVSTSASFNRADAGVYVPHALYHPAGLSRRYGFRDVEYNLHPHISTLNVSAVDAL